MLHVRKVFWVNVANSLCVRFANILLAKDYLLSAAADKAGMLPLSCCSNTVHTIGCSYVVFASGAGFPHPKVHFMSFDLIYNALSPRQICCADFPFLNNNTNKHGNKCIVWGTLPLILLFDDLLWWGIKSEVDRSLILSVVNLPFA